MWSPLEYTCHVRDVCRLFDARIHLMLSKYDRQFSNWNQDETAVADRSWQEHPAVVSAELADAGEAVASSVAAVGDDEWLRLGGASDGAPFTVESFGRYFVHDWGAPRLGRPSPGRWPSPSTNRRGREPARTPGFSRVSWPVMPPASLTCSLCVLRSWIRGPRAVNPGNPVLCAIT